MNICYQAGVEKHCSNWGHFFVFGLNDIAVAVDDVRNRKSNHYNFQVYEGIVPEGTVFNIHIAEGNKCGPDSKAIYVCKVVSAEEQTALNRIDHKYTGCFCEGKFKIVASVEKSVLKVNRFTAWWQAKPDGVDPEAWALHCAKHIEIRGLKDIPLKIEEQ